MNNQLSKHKLILIGEAVGFIILFFVTWLDEGVILPYHWLGSWFGPGTWDEAALESVAIALVGFSVIAYTSCLLSKLHYLESLLRVCAWCRKLELNGKWVPMEEFLDKAGDIKCSHGICIDCASRMQLDTASEANSKGSFMVLQQ